MNIENRNEVVPRTVSHDQHEILDWIKHLHCPDGFDVDATWGNGKFYKCPTQWPPKRYDIDPTLENCDIASSSALPLQDDSVSSIVFDPPFLTYVRAARSGNGNMVMSKRFAGYWRYDELEEHYRESLVEFHRVLRPKGIVVFKCQDIVHNHRLHPTHINVVSWAADIGFRLKDNFILSAKHRMPRPNRKGPPKHARIYHCHFLVLEARQPPRAVHGGTETAVEKG